MKLLNELSTACHAKLQNIISFRLSTICTFIVVGNRVFKNTFVFCEGVELKMELLEAKEALDSMRSNDYYESYDPLEVHKLMLEDRIKNEAYMDAILSNKDSFNGKVVLDIGAGTGILSVFCAQAGAATVYAVEASNVYKVAEETVKENRFENVIKVIHAPVEEIDLPEEVDIIVSEWMGFYLLHEGMIASVINARDKFLKPGGLIFPETATLFAAPCSVPSYFDFWKNVYGVSMNHFAKKLRESVSDRPITEVIHQDWLLTKPNLVAWLDLRDTTIEDINNISVKTIAVATKKGQYQGICLWFNCVFPSKSSEPVVLSTEPDEESTHWKQTTIVLPNSYEVEEGYPLAYELLLRRNEKDHRKYTIEVTMLDADEEEHPEYCTCHLTKCILVKALLKKYEES